MVEGVIKLLTRRNIRHGSFIVIHLHTAVVTTDYFLSLVKKEKKKKATHIISRHTEACSFVSAVYL